MYLYFGLDFYRTHTVGQPWVSAQSLVSRLQPLTKLIAAHRSKLQLCLPAYYNFQTYLSQRLTPIFHLNCLWQQCGKHQDLNSSHNSFHGLPRHLQTNKKTFLLKEHWKRKYTIKSIKTGDINILSDSFDLFNSWSQIIFISYLSSENSVKV